MEEYTPKRVSKTMLETYAFCPRQFYTRYPLGIKSEPNHAMTLGTRFHDFAERFFDFAEIIPITEWESMIPVEFDDLERSFAKWFIRLESARYCNLILEDKYDLFMPYLREEHLVDDKLHIHGYVDRVDWIDKDKRTVRIIEYKTGKKNDDKSIRRQLSFYDHILKRNYNVTAKEYQVINPRMQIDLIYKPHGSTTKAMLNLVDEVWDSIIMGEYEYKCSYGKWMACNCCNICEVEHIIDEQERKKYGSYACKK